MAVKETKTMVFVVCAWVVSAGAQQIKYVDANAKGANTGDDWENAYTELQTAVRALSGIEDAGEIYVKPGIYGPTFVKADWLKDTLILTPNTTIVGVEGATNTIIDGGGVTNCYDNLDGAPMCMCFEGVTFVRGKIGVKGHYLDSLRNCIVSNCEVGVDSVPWIVQSLIVKNQKIGVRVSKDDRAWQIIEDSTISGNGVGLDSCADLYMRNTIIWGNGTDCAEGENPYSLGDPCFVSAERGDCHLKMGSPCIRTGSGQWDGWSCDFDGCPRVVRGAQDWGVYEYQPTNDTQTITVPYPVAFSWLDRHCAAGVAAAGGDYDVAVQNVSSNRVVESDGAIAYRPLWQSYLIGLDPNDVNAEWRTTIAVTNGVPTIGSDPYLENRHYSILGKHSLTDAVWSVECVAPRFFKVRIDF